MGAVDTDTKVETALALSDVVTHTRFENVNNFNSSYFDSLFRRSLHLIEKWLPSRVISFKEIQLLVAEAFLFCESVFTEADANVWANGFEIPQELVTQGTNDFIRHKCNFPNLARERQQNMIHDRMNLERLDAWDPTDPNLPILKGLVSGMVVPVDPDFIPINTPPPVRLAYTNVAPAVNKMVCSLVEQGLVVLLPTVLATKIEGIHYSPISWVTKSNKPQGRPVVDSSWKPEGSAKLNTKHVKNLVQTMWGDIRHPTIIDLVEMVLVQVDRYGWDDVILWKMDLANAFGLLFLDADSSVLMAFELTNGITALYIAGIFGWTGTPFAFDPVSRSLRYVVRIRIDGGVDVFVDDLMGCSHKDKVENDMAITADCITRLLGPKAVAEDKSETGRIVIFIGWEINLELRVLGIARKNILKAIHGFFKVDITKPSVTILELQRLASFADRYSLICRPLLPFVHSFYRNQNHRSNKMSQLKWEQETKLDVALWRAFLVMIHLRPEQFCRPLSSFRHSNATVSIEFDASIYGYGVIIGRRIRQPSLIPIWCGFENPFDLSKVVHVSTYQNSLEFIAIVLGVAIMVRKGLRNVSVMIVGDSMSALSWVGSGTFKSEFTRRAATIYLMLCTRFGIDIVNEEWIAGADNTDLDNLSRLKTLKVTARSLTRETVVEVDDDKWLLTVIKLCDPTKPCDFENEFEELWTVAAALCDNV